MKKILTAAVALFAVGVAAIPQTASAQRFGDQERFVGRYCANHPNNPDCRDWRVNRHRWDRDRYHAWYGRHRHEFGPDDAAAAIFGFAAGAITGAISGAVTTGHVAACQARYRSYNPATDMYLGYDGNYHYCRL